MCFFLFASGSASITPLTFEAAVDFNRAGNSGFHFSLSFKTSFIVPPWRLEPQPAGKPSSEVWAPSL